MADEQQTAEKNRQLARKGEQGVQKLTGTQKVAVLLVSIGVEKASQILKRMSEREVEQITMEIAKMDNVRPETVEAVLSEFHGLVEAKQFILEGGMEYAKAVLTKSKGRHEAESILRRLENETGTDAFGIFQASETENIVQFLRSEHPQVAAVILAHLKLNRAAEILSQLEPEFQVEVAHRLATMSKISSEVVEEIQEVIKDQMRGVYTNRESVYRGTGAVANLLNEAGIATERAVLDRMSERDAELAEEIMNQMFLFEDIAELDDRTIQLIISEIDRDDLVMGLKGVSDHMFERVVENMSSRASTMLKEDMEALGPVHRRQVEEARQNIIREVKRLEDQGEISTRNVGSEELIE